MTPDENRADLQRRADDVRNRKGFTYTVLDPGGRDVIGCVYIYPLAASLGARAVVPRSGSVIPERSPIAVTRPAAGGRR